MNEWFSGRMPKKKRKSISQRVPKRKRKVSDGSDDHLQSKTLRKDPSAGSSSSPTEPTPGCSTDPTWSIDQEANIEPETWKRTCTAVTDSPTNLLEPSSIHGVKDLSQDGQSTEGMSHWKRVEAQDLISEDSSHKFSAQSKDTPTQQGIPNKLKVNSCIFVPTHK